MVRVFIFNICKFRPSSWSIKGYLWQQAKKRLEFDFIFSIFFSAQKKRSIIYFHFPMFFFRWNLIGPNIRAKHIGRFQLFVRRKIFLWEKYRNSLFWDSIFKFCFYLWRKNVLFAFQDFFRWHIVSYKIRL